MKKWTIAALAVILAVTLLVRPTENEAEASTLSQIEKDIAAANQQIRDAERKAANAEEQARLAAKQQGELKIKTEDLQNEINKLLKELDKVANEKAKTEREIDAKEEELLQTGKELDAAIARVNERDELIQMRMRHMYTNGSVSYLDVLFSATSFTDFLDRFDALQTILSSDKQILEEHKKDQELVEQKKADVETQLAQVQELYYELELQQADLIKKESEKEVLYASYQETIEELEQTIHEMEEISAEQEQVVVALAAKVSKLNAEKNRIKNPYSGGKLAMPLKANYRVTSNFGTRIHPITGKKHTHTGIDLAVPSGTPIYAAEAGVVILSQYSSGYGNCIIIDHGNGLWTLYAHIRNGGLLVSEGDSVKRGDLIAEVGSTGNSTGPHLHFEVRKNEVAVNPGPYLK
jgi:Membrane proteins related to metalloendopeptidases